MIHSQCSSQVLYINICSRESGLTWWVFTATWTWRAAAKGGRDCKVFFGASMSGILTTTAITGSHALIEGVYLVVRLRSAVFSSVSDIRGCCTLQIGQNAPKKELSNTAFPYSTRGDRCNWNAKTFAWLLCEPLAEAVVRNIQISSTRMYNKIQCTSVYGKVEQRWRHLY